MVPLLFRSTRTSVSDAGQEESNSMRIVSGVVQRLDKASVRVLSGNKGLVFGRVLYGF